MIELTPQAQSRLDQYLQELRRVLAGSTSVNAIEVEQDVRDHLAAALAGQSAPVGEQLLNSELNKLGAPSQWATEGDAPWFRKSPAAWLGEFKTAALEVGQRLSGGPESYRLGYLSMFILGLGLFVSAITGDEEGLLAAGVVCITAFIFSRAALSLLGAERLTSGQRWLLYPALLVFYVPLLLATVFVVPSVAAVYLYEQAVVVHEVRRAAVQQQLQTEDVLIAHLREQGKDVTAALESRARRQGDYERARQPVTFRGQPLTPALAFMTTVLIAGLWLLILGVVSGCFPGLVRALFYPFADRFARRYAVVLASVGAIVLLGSLAFVA